MLSRPYQLLVVIGLDIATLDSFLLDNTLFLLVALRHKQSIQYGGRFILDHALSMFKPSAAFLFRVRYYMSPIPLLTSRRGTLKSNNYHQNAAVIQIGQDAPNSSPSGA